MIASNEQHNLPDSFMNMKINVKILQTPTPLETSAIWSKNIFNNFASSSFHPLFNPDDTTAIISIYKDEVFSQTFTNNSTLDDSECVSPSDYFMPSIKILRNDVFHALAGLNPRKA
ncbi:hypothetical protein E2C01_049295 [Portunus trituberculatus]|uniref:Uncharacterized protein n=1 Tax=Portunus trituberculatus TaxID=210409 RepID=A0A5B7G919_PORTR|nr:hypothetical protein [Portunus trituberculatus]